MKHRLKILVNAIQFSVGSYLEYLFTLLVSIVIARQLGPEQYGLYTLLMWMSSLGVLFANGGITTGVIKFVAESRGHDDDQLAGQVVSWFSMIQRCSTSLVIVVLLGVGMVVWDRVVPGVPQWILLVLAPAVAFKARYMFYVSNAKGLERFEIISKVVAIVGPLSLLMVSGLMLVDGNLGDYILAYVAVSILYCVVMRMILSGQLPNAPTISLSKNLKARMMRHLRLVTTNAILGFIVLKQSEIAFLSILSSTENVAFYNIGFTLAVAAALLVPGIFSGVLLPLMSRTSSQGEQLFPTRVLQSTRYLLLLSTPVVCLGVTFAHELVNILYGAQYGPAALAFQICLLSACAHIISDGAQSYHMGTDKQGTLLRLLVIAAVINLGLDYFLIKYYGLEGALAANLAAALLLASAIVLNAARLLKMRLEFGVYARTVLAGVIAIVPVLVCKHYLPDLAAIILGTFIFGGLFAVASIGLRCWSLQDVCFARELIERYAAERMRLLDKWLAIAESRYRLQQ